MQRHPPNTFPRRVLRHLWKWFATLLASVVILLALGIGLFRLVVPQVPAYRAEVERWAEQAIGVPVEIDSLDLEWAWTGPELVLGSVRLLGPQARVVLVSAEEVRIMISLRDLFREPLRPSRVILRGPVLDVTRDAEGHIRLAGVPLGGGERELRDWRSLLATLLTYGRAEIHDGLLRWAEDGAAGPVSWRFSDIQLVLQAAEQRYRANGSLSLPAGLGRQLGFELAASGPAGRPETWDWSGRFAGEALSARLAGLLLPGAEPPLAGRLSLNLNARGRGPRPRLVHGSVHLDDLGLAPSGTPVMTAADAPARRFTQLHTALAWQRQADGWELLLDGLRAQRGAKTWPASRWLLRKQKVDGATVWRVQADFARLEDLALAAGWLPAPRMPWVERMRQLDPRGDVRALVAEFRLRDGGLAAYELRGRASGLGWARQAPWPGVQGLDAIFALDQAGGHARLESAGLRADFGELFRNPLYANRLEAELHWQRRGSGWLLFVPAARLANEDVRDLQARLLARLSADGGAWMDLAARYAQADFRGKSRYLPVAIMQEPLVDWLDQAVVSGVARDGRIVVRGRLEDFPWRRGDGLFLITSEFRGVTLDYGYRDDWPVLEELDGRLRFEGMAFTAQAEAARVLGMRLRGAQARIPDMADAVLRVDGRLDLRAEQGMAFLAASPLAPRFSDYLEQVRLTGAAEAELGLELPFGELDASRVRIATRLRDARLKLAVLPEAFTDLQGEFLFTEQGVSSPGFSMRWLGEPVQGAATQTAAGSRFELHGGTSATALWRAFALPFAAHVEGRLDWRAALTLLDPEAETGLLRLVLESGLEQLVLALPAPFGKPAGVARPSRAELLLAPGGRLRLQAESGEARTQLEFRQDGDWAFAGGELVLGADGPEAAPRSGDGLRVSGRLPLFDLGEWQARLEGPDAPAAGGLPDWLARVDLHIGSARAFGQRLEELQLFYAREPDGRRLRLDSAAVAGEIRWPVAPESPVAVDMQRLHLRLPETAPGPPSGAAAAEPGLAPQDLPALRFRAGDLRLDDIRLGEVSFQTVPGADALSLEDLRIEAESFSARGDGAWSRTAGMERSRLRFELESRDVADSLRAFGYAVGVTGDDGRVSGRLEWPGAPWRGEILPVLDGELELSLRDGSLREVEPGAGRLFGLLSLYTLPRRLLLDFSDVLGRGLNYDRIHGNFVISDGDAYTSNLTLSAPAANMLVVGRIGLARRDIEQTVIVDPNVSSALPVAGALAGGPQVGAVLLLLSQLLDEPLQEAGRRQYRISGGWDNPVVQALTPAETSDAPETPQDQD